MKSNSERLQVGFKRGWVVSMLIGLGLVTLVSIPPFVGSGTRMFLMELFSSVCHQLPNRSPHIDGISLAVCDRCYGTYIGFPAAALLFGAVRGAWPFTSKTAPLFLGIALLPAFFDWSGGILGFWTNTPFSRMITGLLMGTAAGYFLTAAIVDAFGQREKTTRKPTRSEI